LGDSPRKKSGLRLIYRTPNHPLASQAVNVACKW
jgi:hypothetical protein